MFVITLSSIPPRFAHIGPTLESLLGQSARPDRVILYIPKTYRRFPDWDRALPLVPKGVEIQRTESDLGPATKVLPAAREFRGQDTDILFGDDDRVYAPGWAARFLSAKRRHPGCAIATRGLMADGLAGTTPDRALQPRALRRHESRDYEYKLKRLWCSATGRHFRPERRLFRQSGYVDMFEGCSGVLVRPDWFDDSAFDIPASAWHVDDVWLSGMLAKNGIPIWLVANTLTPQRTAAHAHAALAGPDRHKTNQTAVRYMQSTYGIWLG